MSAWHAMPLALALGFTGFVLLASAMQRHCDDFAPSPWLGSLRRRRGQGAAALGLALLLCLSQWPAALAVLIWLGLLTFAALALGLLLSYASAHASRFGAWGVAACLLAALWLWLWPWLWRAAW